MCNHDIKQLAKARNVKLWQVAEAYGINDGNFSRLLRKTLQTETRNKIISIIERLSKEVA